MVVVVVLVVCSCACSMHACLCVYVRKGLLLLLLLLLLVVVVCACVCVCVCAWNAMTRCACGYVIVPSRDHNTISNPREQKDPHRSRMPSLSPSLTFTMLSLRVSGAAAAWCGVECCMLHGATDWLAAADRITAWLDGRTPG